MSDPKNKVFREILPEQMLLKGFDIQNFACDSDVKLHLVFSHKNKLLSSLASEAPEVLVDVIGVPIDNVVLNLFGLVRDRDSKVNFGLSFHDLHLLAEDKLRQLISDKFVNKIFELISLQLDELPYELKHMIVKQLSAEALTRMSCVSRSWNGICNEDDIWKRRLQRDFAGVDQKPEDVPWKELYKQEFLKAKRLARHCTLIPINLDRRLRYPRSNLYLANFPREHLFPAGNLFPHVLRPLHFRLDRQFFDYKII